MLLAASLVLAASVTDPVRTPHSIVIAVNAQEKITITMDGRTITCAELDRYFRSLKTGRMTGFDCKRIERKLGH